MKKSSARALCRVLSEPTSETKQDEVTVSMETQVTDDDGVAAPEEEESSPSPRSEKYNIFPIYIYFCNSSDVEQKQGVVDVQ